MTALDWVLLSMVAVGVVLGFFKGIIRQVAGILGLVCGFMFANHLGQHFILFFQKKFGLTQFIAEKVCALLAGILIYILFWFAGQGVHRLFVKKIESLNALNRVGGGLLGGLKAALLLFVLVSFVALLPKDLIRSTFPMFLSSRAFMLVKNYNPFSDVKYADQSRKFRELVKNPKFFEKLKQKNKTQELMKVYGVEPMFDDPDTMGKLDRGDFESLKGKKHFQEFMKDDELDRLMDDIQNEK